MGLGGSKHNYSLSNEEMTQLCYETGFRPHQIKKLFNRFQFLDADGDGYLTKEEILGIPEVSSKSRTLTVFPV